MEISDEDIKVVFEEIRERLVDSRLKNSVSVHRKNMNNNVQMNNEEPNYTLDALLIDFKSDNDGKVRFLYFNAEKDMQDLTFWI